MTPSPNVAVRVPQGGSRVKSYTPLIVPGHHKFYVDTRTGKPGGGLDRPEASLTSSAGGNGGINGQDFYAGARFDLSPEVASLPTPPPTWVIPLARSHSQPNSPTPTTGIRIDVNSLFFTPQVMKASSFPGNEMMGGSSNNPIINDFQERKSPKKPSAEKKIETVQPKTVSVDAEERVVVASSTTTTKKNQRRGQHGHGKNFTSSSNKAAFTSANSNHKSSSKSKYQMESSNDITLGSRQKQMYPHLTEHLRGLLNVQG